MEQFTPQDFEIYDMHAHIFPDKISEKATLSIGKFYDISMAFSIGDPSHLLEAAGLRGCDDTEAGCLDQ